MSEPAKDKATPASGERKTPDRQREGTGQDQPHQDQPRQDQPRQGQPRQNQPGQGHTPEDELTEREGHAGSTLDVDKVTELHDAWQQAERSRPKLPDEDKDGLGPVEHEVRRRTEER